MTTEWIDNPSEDFCCRMELKSEISGGDCRLWKFYFFKMEVTACLYTSGNDKIEGENLMIQERGQSCDDVLEEGRK